MRRCTRRCSKTTATEPTRRHDLAPVPEVLESRYAWRGALIACLLNAIGLPLDTLLAEGVPGMPWWPSLMSSATGLLLVIALLTGRQRPTIRLAATAFLLNTVVILVALWITSGVFAAAPGKSIRSRPTSWAPSPPPCWPRAWSRG